MPGCTAPSEKSFAKLTKEEILHCDVYKFITKPIFEKIPNCASPDERLALFLEVETWEAPSYIQESFPYKFVGYDAENRPIWTSPSGFYNLLEVIERGDLEVFEKYIWQFFHQVAKSIVAKTIEENPSQQAVFVADFRGFSVMQYFHPSVIPVVLKMARKYKDAYTAILGLGLAINFPRAGVWLTNLVRPILPEAFERIELFGSHSQEWEARLRKLFDSKCIPNFEGDYQGFYYILLTT